MHLHTKAVHSGDRKKPASQIPSATPIHLATSYVADDAAQLDRVLGDEEQGYCYARFANPTNSALEALITDLEGGAASTACASGMAALHLAVMTALTDRRKSIVAASALYGATTQLLRVMDGLGVESRYVDVCDLAAIEQALDQEKPGVFLMESISNPLLRVGAMDEISHLCRARGVALVVDSTFATPVLMRPLELGAHVVAHSTTKFLSGHGDVLGGTVTVDAEHAATLRSLSRTLGPSMGPFESYLTMRGIKTFPLRMERQSQNAARLTQWLCTHPRIEAVHYPGLSAHPDAAVIARLLPQGLHGAMVSFAVRGADKQEIFRLMDRLQLIVKGTSLGDVHTLLLYPLIASHRDLAPKQRQRLGIGDNLLRLSAGIEAVKDVIADLEQALG